MNLSSDFVILNKFQLVLESAWCWLALLLYFICCLFSCQTLKHHSINTHHNLAQFTEGNFTLRISSAQRMYRDQKSSKNC